MGTTTPTRSPANIGDGCSLASLLSSESRDFLVSPTGEKIMLQESDGMTIGLYFAGNWYSKCENFTANLTNVYGQLKAQGCKFEVVFVSSDEDMSSFEKFHGTMLWPAIPYNDLLSKRSLTDRFKIEDIPSLMILNPRGELLSADGVELINRYGCRAFDFTSERILELEAEEKAKHSSQDLEKLLSISGRDYVIGDNGQVPITTLTGKTVGLYFSAQWCTPCAKFTSKLASVYNSLKEKNEDFEIVFVSLDRNEAGYSEYYSVMPWHAMPYDIESSKALSRYFDVQGIPTLVIIGHDGKTVTREGRNLINLYLDTAFPFDEAQLQFLQERMDEDAKSYPESIQHVGHHHVLILVSEKSGGGHFICCECDEQGLGWAYLCLRCGYEIHPKCSKQTGD